MRRHLRLLWAEHRLLWAGLFLGLCWPTTRWLIWIDADGTLRCSTIGRRPHPLLALFATNAHAPMQDLRHITPTGVVMHGVKYDHPELQSYRVQQEQKLGTPRSVIVRCEVLEHIGIGPDGTRYRVDLCLVRTLRGRLICLARQATDVDHALLGEIEIGQIAG